MEWIHPQFSFVVEFWFIVHIIVLIDLFYIFHISVLFL